MHNKDKTSFEQRKVIKLHLAKYKSPIHTFHKILTSPNSPLMAKQARINQSILIKKV